MGAVTTLARFSIDTHPIHGLRSIVVNGADWTDCVAGVQITSETGAPTCVDVRIIGSDVEPFEGEGVVQIHSDVDDRQAVLDFLDALDPAEIDRQVLSSMDWGSGSPIVACIAMLREVARGDQS